MKLKERIYKKCSECGRYGDVIQEEAFGCDWCKSEMKIGGGERLDVCIFQKDSGSHSETKHFCSWQCVFYFVPTIKSNYFVTLPMLHYDNETPKGQTAKDFIKLIK